MKNQKQEKAEQRKRSKPMIINVAKGMNVGKTIRDCTSDCKDHCNNPKYPCPIRMLGEAFGS
jgi:hypothetical protein